MYKYNCLVSIFSILRLKLILLFFCTFTFSVFLSLSLARGAAIIFNQIRHISYLCILRLHPFSHTFCSSSSSAVCYPQLLLVEIYLPRFRKSCCRCRAIIQCIERGHPLITSSCSKYSTDDSSPIPHAMASPSKFSN